MYKNTLCAPKNLYLDENILIISGLGADIFTLIYIYIARSHVIFLMAL